MPQLDKLLHIISKTPVLLVAWAYVTLFYGKLLFTNQSAPGGDAKRVLGYVESAKESDYFLPLWNPFSAGGHPSLADPEWLFYRLLSPILNLLPSHLYNLNYNLTLFAALLLLTTAIYCVARSLKIKKIYAVMAASLFVCSGIGWGSFESGRINSIVFLSSGLFLLPLYKNWLHNLNNRTLLALIASGMIHLIFSGYYALVTYGFFFAFAIGCNTSLSNNTLQASIASIKHLVCIGITTLLLGAIFLIPLVELQINALVSTQGTGKIYQSVSLSSLYHTLIPLVSPSKTSALLFPYISFILVPCLLLALCYRQVFSSPQTMAMLVIGLIYLAIGTGFGLPSDTFNNAYSAIPIINLIRWGDVYVQFALLAFILICVAVISSINLEKLSKTIAIIMIIGMMIHLVSPKEFFFRNSAKSMVPRTSNSAAWPELTQTYSSSPKGLRQYCPTLLFCPLNGAPNVPGIIGFSIYFSNESRSALTLLTNQEINVQRPHWIGRSPCSKLDETALEMTSVRYVFCKGKQTPNGSSWSLKRTSISHQYHHKNRTEIMSLWENSTINSPVKLFYSQSQKTATDLTNEQLKVFWKKGIIALDTPPIKKSLSASNHIDDKVIIETWDEENRIIDVSNKTDAVLYLSTLYDKDWQATLNSKNATLHRAYGAFQAIKLSAGENRVQLQYKPKSWLLGKIVSTLSLLCLFLFLLTRKNKKLRLLNKI